MQPYRKDGLIFGFCGAAAALFALAQPLILTQSDLLTSSSGTELIAVPALQALLCALCSFVLLRSASLRRVAHLALAGCCVAVVAGLLFRGWGLLAIFLAVPTLIWAYNLKRVGA